jgi:hypothetical protein
MRITVTADASDSGKFARLVTQVRFTAMNAIRIMFTRIDATIHRRIFTASLAENLLSL